MSFNTYVQNVVRGSVLLKPARTKGKIIGCAVVQNVRVAPWFCCIEKPGIVPGRKRNGEKEMSEIDEKFRNIRPNDKLDYRYILAQKVNQALIHSGSDHHGYYVNSLRDAMYFDIPGMPWKTLIDEREEQMKLKYKKKEDEFFAPEKRYTWAQPWKKGIFYADLDKWYYHEMQQFLIDILARFNALVEPMDFVDRGGEFGNE